MDKKYRVTLTAEERQDLEALIHKGKGAARKLTRARILLKADASPQQGPAWSDEQIRAALDVGLVTIYRVLSRVLSKRVFNSPSNRAPGTDATTVCWTAIRRHT